MLATFDRMTGGPPGDKPDCGAGGIGLRGRRHPLRQGRALRPDGRRSRDHEAALGGVGPHRLRRQVLHPQAMLDHSGDLPETIPPLLSRRRVAAGRRHFRPALGCPPVLGRHAGADRRKHRRYPPARRGVRARGRDRLRHAPADHVPRVGRRGLGGGPQAGRARHRCEPPGDYRQHVQLGGEPAGAGTGARAWRDDRAESLDRHHQGPGPAPASPSSEIPGNAPTSFRPSSTRDAIPSACPAFRTPPPRPALRNWSGPSSQR